MRQERIRCILSGLKKYDLTETETLFVYLVEKRLNQNGVLTEKHEAVLEDIYWKKTELIREVILSMLSQNENRTPDISRGSCLVM